MQSEDCLGAVLIRALPGKSEDFSFGMKQRHNGQSTSEEADFPPSHCFEKCVMKFYVSSLFHLGRNQKST
jgi:hypothetical protein